MSDVWSTFNDSYLKKLKRPEYWGFQPDQASGSSMVSRSEEQNPWAGRNDANAKFGLLGKGTDIQNTSKVMSELPFAPPPMALPTSRPSEATPFQGLLTDMGKGGSKLVSDWAGKKIPELFQGPQSFEALSPEMQGFASAFGKGSPDVVETLSKQFNLSPEAAGTYDKLLGQAVEKSTEELAESSAAAATQSIPWVGPALGLGKDLLTGDLFKRPGQSLGTAGGALGGAALGSMIFPGVGTVLGGLLGGSGGGFLGRTLGRLF